MALVDTIPGFVEMLAATQPKGNPETDEAIGYLREAVQLELGPGGMLYDDGGPSEPFRIATLRGPLKAYVLARKNPTAAAAVPIVGAALLVGVGYLIGRYRR